MKTPKTISALLVVFFIASVIGCAEPITTEQRLAEIASLVEDIESYRVTMTMEMEVMGQPMTTEQEITFKKPNKARTISTGGMMGAMGHETYSNGNVMWSYMPTAGMATKMDVTRFKSANQDYPGMAGGGNPITMFKNIPKDKIEYIDDKITDEGLAYVFKTTMFMDLEEEMPQEASEFPMPAMMPKEMVFWISAGTGLPVKMIMIGKNDKTMMEMTYSEYEINPEIDDSIFEFTPPEGVQVMDMTHGAENIMKQMMDKNQMRRGTSNRR